jgi:Anti-sigma-28 factor, FlgM
VTLLRVAWATPKKWGPDPVRWVGQMTDTVPMNGMAGEAMSPNRITDIKRQINAGEYQVDPYVIADAMIRWAELDYDFLGRRRPRAHSQKKCSKPDSSSPLSVKIAPTAPSTTVPITVRPALAVGQAA